MRKHRFTAIVIAAALLLMMIGSAHAQAPVTVSAQPVELTISVTDGTVDFGAVEIGGRATTQTTSESQTVTNQSSVDVILLAAYAELAPGVFGADCTGDGVADWTPVAPAIPPMDPGPEQFHLSAGNLFSNGVSRQLSEVGIPVALLASSAGPEPAVLGVGASSPLDYSIFMPSETVQTNACTIGTVLIAAVAQTP